MRQLITIHFIAACARNTGVKGTFDVTTLSVKPGKSLMQAATAHGVDGIAADCGGLLTCATCHVFIAEEFVPLLPPPSAAEQAMLAFAAEARQSNSRLSCQIKLTAALDGLTVKLPLSQY